MNNNKSLIILCLIGLTCGEIVNLNYNDGMRFLDPILPRTNARSVSRIYTTYNLRADFGCKFRIGCIFKTNQCSEGRVRLRLGDKTKDVCVTDLENGENGFVELSASNSVDMYFINNKATKAVYCHAQATKPYLNQPNTIISSSEDGKEPRRKPACRCGWANKDNKRIIGGDQTEINEYPFMVRIGAGRSTFCGGSIIAPKIVLTAAHCFDKQEHSSGTFVLVGDHDIHRDSETNSSKKYYVDKILTHGGYNKRTNVNDISLLIFDKEIQFNEDIGRVCLPKTNTDLVGSYIKVIGWGKVSNEEGSSSNLLRQVNLRVIDKETCTVIYSLQNDTSQICTYSPHKDSCGGDSGGPLVKANERTHLYEQIGLVSYGHISGCGLTNPGVSIDVRHYLKWIKDNVAKYNGGEVCA